MKKLVKKEISNYEKPFDTQEELRNTLIDKFSKFGKKVKYQVKIIIK